jgi:predicted RND superfamily exporter protein
MLNRYFELILRNPFITLFAVLLALVATGSGVKELTFTSDFRAYFSEKNPELHAFEAMEKRFSRQDNLYFLVSSVDQSLFSEKGLSLIELLTEEAWTLPHVQRVDSLQNFQNTDVDGDELIIDNFYRMDELPENLSELQQKAINHPDLVLKTISENGEVTGINLTLFLPDGESSQASLEAVDGARQLLQAIRSDYPEFLIELGGSATSNVTMGEAIGQDISSLLIISFAVMLVIMLVMLRTISGVVLVTALIGMSVLITMGLFGWAGYTLTPPTGFVPTAIMTIAVADTIHILVSYYFHLREGEEKREALLNSLRINFAPVFITSITTMVGVLALNTSDSPPYRDMGNMIAVGVMVAWALTITFLPAALTILPAPDRFKSKGQHRWMDTFADRVIRHHKVLFIVMLAVVAGCATMANRNIITERWHEFFDESFEVRRTVDNIDKSLKGLHALYFVADSQKNDGINQVDFLHQLDEFDQWLEQQPGVVHVSSLTDTIKRLNKNLHQNNDEWFRIPESSEAAAQYLLLYELSLPMGLGLETTMTSDRSATRLSATLERTDSASIREIERAAVKWAQENAPLLNITETTGLDVVFANLTHRNVSSMLEGTALALVIISLLMIGALRSLRLGLISMVPNVFPALMAYGLWGIIVGHVDTATSVVACLSLGIVVDDTVHFLSKYNYARTALKRNVEDAIRYAFHTVGIALLITSAILVGGFTVMEFSHFNPSRSMGLLLALTIAVALVIDFLLLPPLLLLADRRKNTTLDNTVEDKLDSQRA